MGALKLVRWCYVYFITVPITHNRCVRLSGIYTLVGLYDLDRLRSQSQVQACTPEFFLMSWRGHVGASIGQNLHYFAMIGLQFIML